MSSSTDEVDDSIITGGPTANIRLYLRCGNLPKSIINQQPDTIARVSILPPPPTSQGGSSSSHQQQEEEQALPPPVPPPPSTDDDEDGDVYSLIDETEIVYKSSNPRYTTTFSTQYEYGSQLLFFVDLFAVRTLTTTNNKIKGSSSLGNIVNRRGMKLLGRAVFDVQDVLGSRNNVKARRLRKGGVIYAHVELEQQHEHAQTSPSSPTRSLTSSITSSTTKSNNPDCQILNLRLRADSLIHTHSNLSKVVHVSNPTTYYEISRPSSLALHGSSWIVVYRSPPIKESVSPLYDESMIDLTSFTSTSSTTDAKGEEEEWSKSPIMMTVYKVKRKKCKEIGSFETTIQSLIDAACNTGINNQSDDQEQSENDDDDEEEQHKTFQLRPTIKKGVSRSDEITGNITVVKAKIENSNDAWKRSFKFLSNVNENDDMTEGESSYELNDCVDTHHHHQQPSTIPRPMFSDYVRAGTVDIDFCVAIDFTSSNGDPRIPGSQHYSRDGMMNDYEEAIVAIGDTIGKYSTEQRYPVWGFGAKYGGKVRHIFQCGNDPTVYGTEGILDAYRTVWETDLIMSGPTVLTSVLRAAAARSKKFYNSPPTNMNMQYCVLLILTDGIVADLKSTQELVRSYSNLQLPLSVIVIGIGRADFSQFHQWNKAPGDIRGRFVFVEFRENQFDTDTLSRKALLHVPHDIVDYYMSRNILP